MSLPHSLGGIVGFVISAVLMAAVGIYVINRVGFINRIVYGKAA
jgi:hypothetical protein